jgi:hypothetical protein
MVAVRVVLETKVVDRGEPFQFTTEVDTKFVPFTAKVKFDLPAVVEVGLIKVNVGTGFVVAVTVKTSLFDVPPPGAGFTTVTGNVPVAATSPAGMIAVSSVEEANVVVAATPLKSMAEFEMKFVPSTVIVKSGLPTAVEVGLIEVTAGTGFAAAVIVNVSAFDVPPPGAGFTTVTRAVPDVATSAAVIVAVIWVEEANVVVRDVPFQFTTESVTKFVPFTVSVKSELLAAMEMGEREVVVGTGFNTVNVCAFDVPPPGAGFTTVTESVPASVISVAVMAAVS